MNRRSIALVLGCFLLPLAAGCQGTITRGGGDGGDGGTGGGTGGNETPPNTGWTTTDWTTSNTTPCPAQLSLGQGCIAPGNLCTYDGGNCDVDTYCIDGVWTLGSTTCPSDCGSGAEGGFCLNVGAGCSFDDECGGSDWKCESNHTWSVIYWDSLCCYNPVNDCPAAAPNDGDLCDICADLNPCIYQVATACGLQPEEMACSQDDALWHVITPPPPCN